MLLLSRPAKIYAVPPGDLLAAVRLPVSGRAPVLSYFRPAQSARPRVTIHNPPASKPAASKPTKNSPFAFGVAVLFDTYSASPVEIPASYQDVFRTSKSRAWLLYRAGCFDWHLSRARIGVASQAVRLLFDHDEERKLCSTISGALVVKATEKALLFSIDGTNSTDARTAIAAVKPRPEHRFASIGASLKEGNWCEGGPGEPGILDVTKARLLEISIVARPAFDRTCLMF